MGDPEKKSPNKWLALINIPFQMGVIIAAGVFFGRWLDDKFSKQGSLFTIIFSLLAVFLALYNVLLQVKKLNKE
ncbi:MAG TPA: AtpZ/AtpI family protein [Flavobacterium sp.]|uniref:AtpZ/AtpI family protein n=1 Tax=Flavobacterium sp. TaxID=239 RepID=UPI002C4CAE3F|nr:AtpZ/AtpI family protein [Flavobacterium sp.]HSD14517.1 AtpZ/AtpI family protein [Flavobacterium sp.]